MEIIHKSWNEVSITNYRRIVEICEDGALDDTAKNVGVLAILCECSEDDIWALPVFEVGGLMEQIGWLGKFDFNQKWNAKHINIGGEKYDVCTDLGNFSVAQYYDFQGYWRGREGHEGLLLATFVLPHGKKYQEDYDVAEVAKIFEDNISICDYNALCFFFLRLSANLMKASRIYLEWTIRRLKRKNKKDLKTMEKLQRAEAELKRLDGFVL